MRALGFAPFLFGGTLGVALAFAAAWFALEIIRRIDDAMGSFSEEVSHTHAQHESTYCLGDFSKIVPQFQTVAKVLNFEII